MLVLPPIPIPGSDSKHLEYEDLLFIKEDGRSVKDFFPSKMIL